MDCQESEQFPIEDLRIVLVRVVAGIRNHGVDVGHRDELELQRHDHTEVAPAATQGPQQLGAVGPVGAQHEHVKPVWSPGHDFRRAGANALE